VPAYNTIAEIRGRNRPNEYVMLSAHFDSWDGATGATDNGTGTVVMMEAMRILRQVYPNPRRTILVGHWGGEEQGLIGSRAFVEDNPRGRAGECRPLQPGQRHRPHLATSPCRASRSRRVLRALAGRVPTESRATSSLQRPGCPAAAAATTPPSSAHGAPAFMLGSLSWDYGTYTWHTNRDTFDKIAWDDVRNNAILVAMLAYLAAEEPERFLWLEEVESPQALAWVEAQNAETLARLRAHPAFDEVYERALSILTSDDRIPFPALIGDRLYNFWQDAEHPRGLWRRTSWEGYLSGSPAWETVLDIDALAARRGGELGLRRGPMPDAGLPPLPGLGSRAAAPTPSRSGSSTSRTRSSSMDGFYLPEAKQSVAWVTEDTLLVATDFGEGSHDDLGVRPRREALARGTPLDEARTLFEGAPGDVRVGVGTLRSARPQLPPRDPPPELLRGDHHVLVGDELVRLDLPVDATPPWWATASWSTSGRLAGRGPQTFPQGR
jgi:hypothetical protein